MWNVPARGSFLSTEAKSATFSLKNIQNLVKLGKQRETEEFIESIRDIQYFYSPNKPNETNMIWINNKKNSIFVKEFICGFVSWTLSSKTGSKKFSKIILMSLKTPEVLTKPLAYSRVCAYTHTHTHTHINSKTEKRVDNKPTWHTKFDLKSSLYNIWSMKNFRLRVLKTMFKK